VDHATRCRRGESLGIGVVPQCGIKRHIVRVGVHDAFDEAPPEVGNLFVQRNENHEEHHVAGIPVKYGGMRCYGVRRPIGTFYLLAQKLVFHNSDLNKSTTIYKVGDLEVFPKAFLVPTISNPNTSSKRAKRSYVVFAAELYWAGKTL
jgi:hypothetical protein